MDWEVFEFHGVPCHAIPQFKRNLLVGEICYYARHAGQLEYRCAEGLVIRAAVNNKV
jgi:hypothetical protein